MFMYWGEAAERWCPSGFLRSRYPGVRVYDVDLPGRLQGCIDHEQQVIWLRAGMTEIERRCTLAFEVAQLQQGPTPEDPCLAAAHQRAAVEWAARMLIDCDDMIAAFARAPRYQDIAELLQVDVPTLRARLRGMTDAEQDGVLEAIHSLRLSA